MSSPKKPSSPRSRTRSRAETAEDFQNIRNEVNQAESVDPKTAAVVRARSTAIRSAAQGVTVETVVQKTAALNLEMQRALANINEKLVETAKELADTTEAVRLEKEELENLHKLDVAATSIAILVQDYDAKNKELEEAYDERKAGFEREEAERARRRQDEDRLLADQRKRERDEYEYRKTQERARVEDEFNEKMRVQARNNAIRQEEQERTWTQREVTLAAQEADVVKLREEVTGFPDRLKKETDAAVAIATNSLKRNLEQDFALKSKDMETNARIQQAQINDLTKQLEASNAANARLQAQLDAANAKVESIATKAIEGSSKRDAFEAAMQLNQSKDNSAASRGKA
jgi:hypothetical protein